MNTTARIFLRIPLLLIALLLYLTSSPSLASKGEKNTYVGIDIDKIKYNEEFAALFPDYTLRFTGLVDQEVEIPFFDIIRDYGDRIETQTVRGLRTDEETVEIQYTGINLTNLVEELVLKIVQQNDLTKKWVKNPVLFDFVAEYIDAVPPQDRPDQRYD